MVIQHAHNNTGPQRSAASHFFAILFFCSVRRRQYITGYLFTQSVSNDASFFVYLNFFVFFFFIMSLL